MVNLFNDTPISLPSALAEMVMRWVCHLIDSPLLYFQSVEVKKLFFEKLILVSCWSNAVLALKDLNVYCLSKTIRFLT